MITIDTLTAFGADVKTGLGRCMNNEAFYLRLVGMVLGDANFEKLENACQSGDVRAAFEAAHALKGATGNLSLNPIYEPICAVTELTRGQEQMPDISARVEEALAKYRELKALA